MGMVLVFLVVMNLAETGAVDHEDMCKVKMCGSSYGAPPVPVRFPFWLKDQQPHQCGYPDPSFQLTCDENKQTLLHLPGSVEIVVRRINYTEQKVFIYDCIAKRLPYLNLSASSFQVSTEL
ncbi:hypothetical protein CCACVL1_25783 [Corchorus capsularis]|uniref:RING-type E3 ubiquitin transferase n=1 Tax=Corchorus capsularis TaxID=210143 RepID=A0A1R3GH70_COCAP|nr:hypothetical protein CCACVL1_25783 [Corchorus capsularis]